MKCGKSEVSLSLEVKDHDNTSAPPLRSQAESLRFLLAVLNMSYSSQPQLVSTKTSLLWRVSIYHSLRQFFLYHLTLAKLGMKTKSLVNETKSHVLYNTLLWKEMSDKMLL